ncbi:MAG: tetratricopeptide repeat protein [Planctomycetota bacterium]
MGAADSFFLKAEQALKKRNYDYAIELWQQGLAIDPDRLDERIKLRATEIKRCHETGANTQGGSMFSIKNAGLLMRLSKAKANFEELIVDIEKVLATAPQNSKSLFGLANAFAKTDRVPSALQIYKEIVAVEPNSAEAYKAMAKLHRDRKEYEKSVECWERVKAVDPSDQEAGKAIRDMSAGLMMQRQEDRRSQGGDGSFRDMLKSTEEAAKLEKKGAVIRTVDDAKAAIGFKEEEIQGDAQNPRLWRELGDLHVKIKQFTEAEVAYRKAIELNPTDIYTAERLGKLTEARLKNDVEEKTAKLAKDPQNAALQAEKNDAVRQFNKFMLEEYGRRVTAYPTDMQLKFVYGTLLFRNKQYDEAIGQFQKANKDPKFATSSTHYAGKCFYEKKLYDIAIKQFKQALAGVSDHDTDLGKELTYDLAKAFMRNGDKPQALEQFEKLMALDIGYKDVSRLVDEIRGAETESEARQTKAEEN